MEKNHFKLTNLRELSTEEQLRLFGGNDVSKCATGSCTCNCPCRGDVNSKKDSEDCSASHYASSMLS